MWHCISAAIFVCFWTPWSRVHLGGGDGQRGECGGWPAMSVIPRPFHDVFHGLPPTHLCTHDRPTLAPRSSSLAPESSARMRTTGSCLRCCLSCLLPWRVRLTLCVLRSLLCCHAHPQRGPRSGAVRPALGLPDPGPVLAHHRPCVHHELPHGAPKAQRAAHRTGHRPCRVQHWTSGVVAPWRVCPYPCYPHLHLYIKFVCCVLACTARVWLVSVCSLDVCFVVLAHVLSPYPTLSDTSGPLVGPLLRVPQRTGDGPSAVLHPRPWHLSITGLHRPAEDL